jgi:transcriptional regulator with XRE-family HTH domain
MVTTSESGNKQLPEYALKIRETRKACKFTQAKFAKKLGKARVTVARWETATREPDVENYAALHRLAREKSLDSASFFFEREQAGKVSLEDKTKRSGALEHLEAIERDAAAGRLSAKVYLEWADHDPAEVRKHFYGELEAAREILTNGEFSLKAKEIFSQIAALEDIWFGREVRAGRAAEGQRRQTKRFLASQKRHSRAVKDVVETEKEMFEALTAKVNAFLDELSSMVEQGNWPLFPILKEKILAECGELSPRFSIIQWNAGYAKCSARVVQILEQAARSAARTDDVNDLVETVSSLFVRLRHELAAMKAKG